MPNTSRVSCGVPQGPAGHPLHCQWSPLSWICTLKRQLHQRILMDRLAHNLSCIESAFAALGFAPERRVATGVQLYVSLEQGLLSLSALSAEEGTWIAIYGTLPICVPPDRRAAVAEAMMRINYQQVIGSFELDVSSGGLRYRIGYPADVGVASAELVQRLVEYVLHVWRSFHQPLMRVAFGGASPEDAVREAEALAAQPAEAPTDAPGSGDTAEPPDIDAILQELGLAGPIGSLPGEQPGEQPADSSAPSSIPFPNAYIVPGTRLIAGEYPGAKDLTTARAKIRALLDAGVTRVIDLTCARELRSYADLLGKEAAARGVVVQYRHRPIEDVGVCTSEQMYIILDEIDDALARGGTVYVHSRSGAGRAGTVVGCWLVRHGRAADEALAEVQRLFGTMSPASVARHPDGSPETAKQRDTVRRWLAMERVREMLKEMRDSETPR